MSERISFTVPGRPAPQVRITQRGVHVKDHRDRAAMDRYLAYKRDVGWAAKASIPAPLAGDVRVTFDFYLCRKGNRPDIDNLIKAGLDGMNKIAFKDDRQVIQLEAMLLPADDPEHEMTRIMVEEG